MSDTNTLQLAPLKRPRKCSILAEILLLFLVFLLPLKFGGIVGLPEVPMTYWKDTMGILIGAWPINLFPVFSLGALIVTLLFAFPRKEPAGGLLSGLYAGSFLLLAMTAFCGMKNASTWDFVTSYLPYFAGMGCLALNLWLLLENDPAFGKKLWITLGASFLFVLHCALNQYIVGFREMEEYLAKQAQETGQELSLAFRRRLAEQRVTADFAAGNVFCGYLLLTFPLLMGLLWKWGGKVTPPLATRLVLLLPTCGLFLFLLNATKSRGSFLALAGGLFLACCALPLTRFLKYLFAAGTLTALGGFVTLIAFDRGPRSIIFRLDYWQGAIRMMWENLFWGAGWGEFFHDFHRMKLHLNDESPHSPHNILLSAGSQSGLLSFLLCLILLILPLAAAFLLVRQEARKAKEEREPDALILKWSLLAALGAWAIHSLGEIDLEVPGSLGCYMVVSFLALQLFHKEGLSFPGVKRFLPESPKGKITVFSVCLLFALASAGTILTLSPKVIAGEMAFDHLHTLCNTPKNPQTGESISMEEIQQALSICVLFLPRSPFPWDRASNAAAMRGEVYTDLAFALLAEAEKRAPERSTYAYRMYLAMRKLGRKEEAEKYLEKAKKLSPKNINYYHYLPSDEDIQKMPSLW